MSGFFGVVSKSDCVIDLFFGTDYHSHLGTKRGGMAVFNGYGFNRSIHNIENSPFRTKFERDVEDFSGCSGIGCISDTEPQPLLVNSHIGSFAITTVGRINNIEELREECFNGGKIQFMEMSNGVINPTELVAAIINLIKCFLIKDIIFSVLVTMILLKFYNLKRVNALFYRKDFYNFYKFHRLLHTF